MLMAHRWLNQMYPMPIKLPIVGYLIWALLLSSLTQQRPWASPKKSSRTRQIALGMQALWLLWKLFLAMVHPPKQIPLKRLSTVAIP